LPSWQSDQRIRFRKFAKAGKAFKHRNTKEIKIHKWIDKFAPYTAPLHSTVMPAKAGIQIFRIPSRATFSLRLIRPLAESPACLQ
jgi:hypothetical protein